MKKYNTKYKDYYIAIKKGYWNGKMNYCEDITKEWIGTKKKKNIVIKHNNYEFFNYKRRKYYIDNHHIKIDFKNDEIKLAEELAKLTDKRIELFPRFDFFKSTDVKIGKEYIDFKITTSDTDKFVFNNIHQSQNQSNNYIFWIKNTNVLEDIIQYQIDNIFRRIKNIKLIGYYRNGKLFIFKRK